MNNTNCNQILDRLELGQIFVNHHFSGQVKSVLYIEDRGQYSWILKVGESCTLGCNSSGCVQLCSRYLFPATYAHTVPCGAGSCSMVPYEVHFISSDDSSGLLVPLPRKIKRRATPGPSCRPSTQLSEWFQDAQKTNSVAPTPLSWWYSLGILDQLPDCRPVSSPAGSL